MYIHNYVKEFENMFDEIEFTEEQEERIDQTVFSFVLQLARIRHADVELSEQGYLEIQEYEEN